jgi:short-subunit dehydrogenase
VLTARRRDALDAIAETCASVKVDIVTADLGKPDAARALWDTATATGPIDILINNAGFGYFRPFRDADWARDAELVQLNITSVVELSRQFVDDRVTGFAHDRAHLVNIASIGAYQSVPHMAVYAASKAFVRNFTEALHDELRGTPIRVTCVCPGGTATAFHAAAGAGNYGWLASATMMSAEAVARTTVRAMRRGTRNVVPGLANKLACWAVRLVSRRVASWMSSRVLGKPRAAALPSRTAA